MITVGPDTMRIAPSIAAMGHGMQHDDPNMVMVAPGKRAELTWTFSQSTPIEFACNVPGHYQAGMVGKVRVLAN